MPDATSDILSFAIESDKELDEAQKEAEFCRVFKQEYGEEFDKYGYELFAVYYIDTARDYSASRDYNIKLIEDGQKEKIKLPEAVNSSLETLIDYTLENEEKHFEESDRPTAHIYAHALRISKWFNKIKKL